MPLARKRTIIAQLQKHGECILMTNYGVRAQRLYSVTSLFCDHIKHELKCKV
jgi:hypothetical protein